MIDIRSNVGFHWGFKALAIFFIGISFLVISEYPVLAAFLSFSCLLILTGRNGVEINKKDKYYKPYMAFLYVIKMGKPVHYEKLHHLTIKPAEPASVKKLAKYQCFLVADDQMILLITDKNLKALEEKTEVLSRKLQVPVE